MFKLSKKPLAILLALVLLCASPLTAFAADIVFDESGGVTVDTLVARNGESGITIANGTWSMESGTVIVTDQVNSVSGDGSANSIKFEHTDAIFTLNDGSTLRGIAGEGNLTLNVDGSANVGSGGVIIEGNLGIIGENAGGGDTLTILASEGPAIRAGGTLTIDKVAVSANNSEGPAVSAGSVIIKEGATLNGQGYAGQPVIPIRPGVTRTGLGLIDDITVPGEADESDVTIIAYDYTIEQIAAAKFMAGLLDAYAKAWNTYEKSEKTENDLAALMDALNPLLDAFLAEGGAADILAAMGSGYDKQTLSYFRGNEAKLSKIGDYLRSAWRTAAAPYMDPGLVLGSIEYGYAGKAAKAAAADAAAAAANANAAAKDAANAAATAAKDAAVDVYTFMYYLIELLTEMRYYPIPTAN